MSLKKLRVLSIIALSFALFLPSCVTIEESAISGNRRAYGYSWEREIEIGREADQSIIAEYGVYDDEELSKYVTDLGEELLAVSHLRREGASDKFKNTEFTFRVLDSPVVNAFALPGGYVYVTRGLLGHLENEAQLAVVLGHEIGHVAARHASQRAVDQTIGQVAILGGAVLGEAAGLNGAGILQGGSQAAQLLLLSYGRDDERESDRLGVEYSAFTGYDAAEGGKFFTSLKRISKKSGFDIPSHLSSHPDPGEREKNIPRMAAEWEDKGYEQTVQDQEEFYSYIADIMYGDNPRNGYVDGGVFYHPDLKFSFDIPDSYDLVNQPTQVVLFNEDQTAISIFSIDSENETPEAAVNAFLTREGVTEIGKEALKTNGYDAYQGRASITNDESELSILLTAVAYGGNIYTFLSYSATDQFAGNRAAFESIPDSFTEVNDPAVLNIKPVRLRLVTVNKTATFSDLLPQKLPLNIEPLDIAILNQVELTDTIEAGTVIKIPEQY